MRKKVLLISESMGGGLRKHVMQLIENLDSNKYKLYFIHGTAHLDNVFVESIENLSFKVDMIPCPQLGREINFKNDLKAFVFIMKNIIKIKPDIVHCHSSKAGTLGRLAAKLTNVAEVFYTPHAYAFLSPEFSEHKKKLFITIEKYLNLITTTRTVNVSNSEKNIAINYGVGKEKDFIVIYNGLEKIKLKGKNQIRLELGLPLDKIIIGNNARLSPQKNPIEFLKVALALKNDDNYFFVWCGNGPQEEQVKKFISDKNLRNTVLLGYRTDTEYIVAAYDLFLITSNYEGLPYSVIEALRANIEIILSDVAGNREIGTMIGNHSLYEPGNIASVVTKIKKLKFNQNCANDIIFDNFFDLRKMINSIERLYDES